MLLPLAILASLNFNGNFTQAGMVETTAPSGTVMYLDGERVDSYGNKYLFAFHREHKPGATLKVKFPDGKTEVYKFAIEQREWDVQHINKVSTTYTNPDNSNQKRIRKDAREIGIARVSGSYPCPEKFNFQLPMQTLITGWFGSQRVYNGNPGSPHSGVDFRGDIGEPIYAAEAGRVAYVSDMFLTGLTVMLDHGCGVSTYYSHMNATNMQVGDIVERGDKIGEVGKTGLATGPHLHWGANLNSMRLDPLLLVK